ncbi:MAG: molecular chaperone HtpG, partial [Oscillospiraceae bacterium]
QNEENQALFDFMKEALGDRVTEVKASGRLKGHPVIITASGGLSLEMEKVLNTMPTGEKVSSQKILEINAEHPVFARLKSLFETDQDKVKQYAELLYNQALLIEGLPIADPVAYTQLVCELMAE